MSKGIEIGIGTNYDPSGVSEANKSLANLVADIGRANGELRDATMRASRSMVTFAEKADNAIRAMGGGYKDAEEFVNEAKRANEAAAQSVKKVASAYEDFGAILRRSAEAVDRRNRNMKQAEEVSKVLAAEQEKLGRITDKSSDAYAKTSRNVEILTQTLKSLGVQVRNTSVEVERQPKTWTGAFARVKSGVGGFFTAIGRNLANIHHGFMMAASAVRTFASALRRGMEFEAMTVRFKSLTGSMELARSHMKDLQDLGRTPPFSLEQFAAASQQMLKMTGGMVGFRKEMEVVGDMAAATGNSIEAVGRAFGLAYQVVRDGAGFGRAGQMLYTMGILTRAQVKYFDDLAKSGRSNADVWNELREVFNRYNGAMKETENTTNGVVSAIKGEAEVALTDFSKAITEAATPALKGLLGFLKRINEDGTIEDWADRSADAITSFLDKAKGIADVFKTMWDFGDWLYTRSGVQDFVKVVQGGAAGIGGAVGTLAAGGSLREAFDAYDSNAADWIQDGFYARKAMKAGWFGKDEKDKVDADDAAAVEEENARLMLKQERARKKAEKKAKEQSDAQAEAELRMEEDLARAQKKRDDEKRAKDFREFSESGSNDTFEVWLRDKTKAEAEKLKEEKKAFAEFQRKSGIDADANADNVGDYDEQFIEWKKFHDKKVEQEAADAKRLADERLAAEEKAEAELHRQRVENARAELKAAEEERNAMQRAISSAQSEFAKAFSMYRDSEAAKRTIEEERDYAADYKRLQKDASRYGGSWRIDELAALMAAGDTQGQAEKLEEWRKSSRFTPEVEAMVRASAADKTRTTAEAELRKIAANTEGLANKLDELLTMKGGM